MGVDQDRQDTATERRRAIMRALNEGFDLREETSHLTAFKALVENPTPRLIVTNADIDGLVSSQMLADQTGWRIAALVDRDGSTRLHPDFESPAELVATGLAFGVDVFSPLFPGVSNHPALFGAHGRTNSTVRAQLMLFDDSIRAAVEQHRILNLSAWVGIGALLGSKSPRGMPYKYPLGTAQFMLACLEAAGLPPRIYDRQYLPWLIANCDGGVDTIRTYAWNAETWWSALAAAVGPASHSESIYRLVTNQRPNEFTDMDRRLRYDEPKRSEALNTKWNLRNSSNETLATASSLLSDLSGWPDAFRGGVASLTAWTTHQTTRNLLPTAGITKFSDEQLMAHLTGGLSALHANFSFFRERGAALGWLLPGTDAQLEGLLGDVALVEEIPEDEPTVAELAQDE